MQVKSPYPEMDRVLQDRNETGPCSADGCSTATTEPKGSVNLLRDMAKRKRRSADRLRQDALSYFQSAENCENSARNAIQEAIELEAGALMLEAEGLGDA